MQCRKSPSHQKPGPNGKTTWGLHSLLYVKPCPYITITMFCCWLHSALVCRTTTDSGASPDMAMDHSTTNAAAAEGRL